MAKKLVFKKIFQLNYYFLIRFDLRNNEQTENNLYQANLTSEF